MRFTKTLPCESLRPYVSSFWQLDSLTDVSLQDTLFPTGSLEVVFNVGKATLTSLLDNRPTINPAIELLGQITRPYSVQVRGHTVLVGVRFHPYSAGLFLRDTLGQFTNSMLDATNVMGSQLNLLQESLCQADTAQEQIRRIEAYLLSQLDQQQEALNRYQLVRFMVETLLGWPHEANVDKLAAYCNLSARYVHKLFVEFVGLPPKQFLKIIRLQKSFAYLQHPTRSLTDIAYRCGYFDQSHFIRDFKAFTGLTPSAYEPQLFPLNGLFL